MKQSIKRISAVLAMAMALSAFSAFGVSAEGESSSTSAPAATPVPTIAQVMAEGGESGGGDNSGSSDTTSAPEAYIASYNISKVDGLDNFWDWNERFDVNLTIYDPQNSITVVRLVNTSVFSGNNYGSTDLTPTTADENGNRTVVLKEVTYHGGGNSMDIQLCSSDGGVTTPSLTIAQCMDVDPNPPEATATPAPAPTEKPEYDYPKILVKDFSFGGTSVEAGKEFTLELTLFTTSGNANLQDVMVGLNFGELKGVSLASGSMNTYVGEMAPNTTKTISYKMMTAATIEPGAISINVNLSSKNGEAATSPISIPVTQPERFDITNMEAPETLMMGEEGYLSVTFVNKGKSSINNLSAEIQGDNLSNPGQSQFLGNIAAGTENSVDFSVIAAAEGTINGKVILSYEDAKGEVKTLEKEFSCTVTAAPSMDDMMGIDSSMMDDAAANAGPGLPIWGWVLIVVGVVIVAVVVVVVIKKKKKAKKLAQLEDEDEDI